MKGKKFIMKEGAYFKNSFGKGFIVPNWKEGEEIGFLKAGKYIELGKGKLFIVYRRPSMYFVNNKAEAEKLSKEFKEEDNLYEKYDNQ